jgi:hypothetical protein
MKPPAALHPVIRREVCLERLSVHGRRKVERPEELTDAIREALAATRDGRSAILNVVLSTQSHFSELGRQQARAELTSSSLCPARRT